MERSEANYIAGTPYRRRRCEDVRRARAAIAACSPPGIPSPPQAVWEIKEDLPLWSGALATGGGLVFYGTHRRLVQGDRRPHRQAAVAVQDRQRDHRPADQLSRPRRPAIYRGRSSGVGGWAGAIVAAKLDPRDPTAALGFVNAMKDLPSRNHGGRDALCLRASALAFVARCRVPGTRGAATGSSTKSRPPADQRSRAGGGAARRPSSPATATSPPARRQRPSSTTSNAYAIAAGPDACSR